MKNDSNSRDQRILKRLKWPVDRVDVVIDTDTYNEIDDQFALAYALRSTERLNIQAIYAAPFHNERSISPADGMNKSYDEILRILELCGREDLKASTYRGSVAYLSDEDTLVDSDAARDLVARSRLYNSEKPLYVIAIGAITNIASAILMDPEIVDRIVLVWLGGHALDWPNTQEFNMAQDVAAARVVFGFEIPLIQLPCMGVVSAFTLSEPEMEGWLRGRNELCDYLIDATIDEARTYVQSPIWSRVIWDVTAVAWLVDERFIESRIDCTPLPEYEHYYTTRRDSHPYRYVYHVHRDLLMQDLVEKLSR